MLWEEEVWDSMVFLPPFLAGKMQAVKQAELYFA